MDVPYWLNFDSRFLAKYRVFTSRPRDAAPSRAVSADPIDELGALVGVDSDALADAVDRLNGVGGMGHDDDLGRGDNTYDKFWGELFEPPFSTLGVIDQPP